MLTTFWVVPRVLFVFIAGHDVLTYILFQALLQDNHQVKREKRIFGCSAIRPGDIFHPDFSDSKNTYFDISVRNSLLSQFLSKASRPLLLALLALLVHEMYKDAKYDHSVFSAGCVFFPLVVGLWTDSSTYLPLASRHCPYYIYILHSGVSQDQAFHNLLQQLSVKLSSCNPKMLLSHISLLPGIEPDPFDHSLFSLEKSSTSNDVNINCTPGCAVSVGSVVDSQVSESPSFLYDSHSVLSTEVPVSIGVPVCNITL